MSDVLGEATIADVLVMAVTAGKTAEMVTPPLTTIDFPAYPFGYQAARMLVGSLDGARCAAQILPRPQLIVRASTGPARNAISRQEVRLSPEPTRSLN